MYLFVFDVWIQYNICMVNKENMDGNTVSISREEYNNLINAIQNSMK